LDNAFKDEQKLKYYMDLDPNISEVYRKVYSDVKEDAEGESNKL